jgi:hypothetical protein
MYEIAYPIVLKSGLFYHISTVNIFHKKDGKKIKAIALFTAFYKLTYLK